MMNKLFTLTLLFLCSSFVIAAENETNLPEPLSFKSALLFADKHYHYSFIKAQSDINLANASLLEYQSKNDVQVFLKGYLRKIGVSELGDQSKDNDSKISLIAKKKLYDFNFSSQSEKLKDDLLQVKIADLALKNEDYLNKVVVAYFNVLKSDNTYLAHNENMAVAFIQFNRAQENLEFGLTSDLDILKAQTNYEFVRQQRYLSEAQQRYTRQTLAELLGASSIPDQLETPKIDANRKIIEDVDRIIELAGLNSNAINLQRFKLKASKQGLKVAAKVISPSIDAEFEVNEYQRDTASRDVWRASINFNFPLYSGNRGSSATLLANARHQAALANMQGAQSELRLKVLTLWQTIKQKTVELEGAKIKQEYRDLYLEQSRANYELEYKSDLGDSMVQFSRSRSERYAVEFDLEIAWYELTLLVGQNNKQKLLKPSES